MATQRIGQTGLFRSVMLIVGVLVMPAAGFGAQELIEMQQDAGSWVVPGKNYALTRYSPLDRISTENVEDLDVAWTFSTGVLRGHEGTPLVVGDTMYIVTPFPNIVYALDLSQPGTSIKWKFQPTQSEDAIPIACCDVVNRGAAYADGKIFFNQLDAHTVALDAETGEQLWKVKQGDIKQGQTITMAPLVVRDKVITGISGGEFGVRGFVTANNINTGEQVWRAYSTGPDADVLIGEDFASPYASHQGRDLGVSTWKGEEWKRGGGTTWGWYSYDPELDLFFYGTGNPGAWNPDQRPGDNKWSMTLFARNPDTGAAKWAYQMTPHDAWDYDGVNESVLIDLPGENGDGPRKALVHFDRNGFAYKIDRTSGTVIGADKFGHVNWAEKIDLETGRPVENPEKRTREGTNVTDICPGAMGTKDQQPVSYSPRTKLFYVPTNHLCMNYEGTKVRYIAGVPYVGALVEMYPGPGGHRGEFIAWDPVAGEKKWGIKEKWSVWSGVLSTAGDVAFYGTMDGWFKAVHAVSGEVLWQFKTGSGIIGAPMTYTGPDGKQYVAVMSGIGGWSGLVVAGDLSTDDPTAALGAVGAFAELGNDTTKGGTLYVFALE